MSTYSDHDQRLLDQQTGAELNRQAQRREVVSSKDVADCPRTSALLEEIKRMGYSAANDRCTSLCWALERALNLRDEQIDGYERQLGIADAGAERTIGSEIERLLHPETTGEHPYLLHAMRFKLAFNSKGNVGCFANFARDLDGRWVALVAAEDDAHMAAYSRVKTSREPGPLCPTCKTELAFEGDVCGLCLPVAKP